MCEVARATEIQIQAPCLESRVYYTTYRYAHLAAFCFYLIYLHSCRGEFCLSRLLLLLLLLLQ